MNKRMRKGFRAYVHRRTIRVVSVRPACIVSAMRLRDAGAEQCWDA
jgi:hypothetical protein